MTLTRCAWLNSDPLYIAYHDKEWGVPVYDERLLFEFLMLEGMQAGLSWITVLKKRENFRESFDNFNPELIAQYDSVKINQLMTNTGIIRNKLKINAIIENAKCYLKINQHPGDFKNFIWQFVDGQPIKNHWQKQTEVPVSTSNSDRMSKELKNKGFKFVGSTICYAYMQAVGMVCDHTTDCFCYKI